MTFLNGIFFHLALKVVVFVVATDLTTGYKSHHCNYKLGILEYLMRSPGRVFTRTQILEHIWGYGFNPSTNLVDVCIQRIRKKIDPLDHLSWIESIRGVGYRFRQPDFPQ